MTVSGASTSSSVAVATSNLPTGVTSQFAPAAGGSGGTLSLVAGSTVPAGTYSASVVVTNGTRNASQSFVLVIAIAAAIQNSVDTTLGTGGKLQQFMSTSFQPAESDYQFFQNHAATEPALLNMLSASAGKVSASLVPSLLPPTKGNSIKLKLHKLITKSMLSCR